MIKLTHRHTYFGPNPYAAEPVILVSLLSGSIDHAVLSSKFRQIRDRFPRWTVDVSNLEILDDVGISRALVSLAHWLLNDVRGLIDTALSIQSVDGPLLVLGFHEPQVSLLALRLGAEMLELIDGIGSEDLERKIREFGIVCHRHHPDYQARILMKAARSRNVPILPFIRKKKLWQYGWGCRSRVLMESLSNADGQIAALLAKNKAVSKTFFSMFGVPTPASIEVNSVAELDNAVQRIGYPCVVKPLDRGGGKGVTAYITSNEQLLKAFHRAREYTASSIMVEQFIAGADYRLIVIEGRFVGAFRREASFIVGDGSRTVREMIDALNQSRSVSLVHSGYLRPIPFDSVLLNHLSTQQIALDEVAPVGRRITLRSNANLSTGGIATDVSVSVHPELRAMVEQMAITAGFGAAGFDYLTTDVSSPPWQSGGNFIEMNTTPGLDAAIAGGWTEEQIGELVLGKELGRIPVYLELVGAVPSAASIASTENNLTEPCAIIAGRHLRIGQAMYEVRDTRPWATVHSALKNKSVASVQIFCRVADITALGLPVDQISMATLHNVTLPPVWMTLLQRHTADVAINMRPKR